MEEIYIVKLKGLPPPNNLTSQDAFTKDAKTSFYYHTDLTAEAIRGFSYLHIFFGITVLCLSVTNLCFHDNPMGLAPPLGITLWCAISFILLGFWGIITAFKRKCDLSGSIIYVKIQLFLIIIVLSLTSIFAILFILDRHGPIANQFIGWNILFSMIVESVILLLTLFTCARVLWPGCIHFCAKDWPMQPNLKRKMIVKTNVFTNAIQQDKASIIQSFGPNCVISLNMPPTIAPSSSTVSASASDPAVSSNGSSLCSSPTTYNKNTNLNNKIYSPSISTSDLAKSLSTIFAIQDDTGYALDNQQQIAKISSNSIYYNYPNVGVCTANLLQTFPTADQQNRQQQNDSGNISTNGNKIDLQNIYQQPLNNNNNNHSGQSWYRGSDTYSGSEGIDPYDTDEFDYCSSTEDEEDNHQTAIVNDECHKSSSDDGNGTLEEDSKSITNSVSSNTTNNTSSDLVTSDECVSLSPKKIDHQYPIECINYNHIDNDDDDDVDNDDNIINEQNNKATSIEIKAGINNSQLKLSSIKQAIENNNSTSTTINNFNDQVVKPEVDENLEDNDHVQIINHIELNGINTTTEQSSTSSPSSTIPYKSSIIKIESPLPVDNQSNKNTANVLLPMDGTNLNPNTDIVINNNNNTKNNHNKSSTESGTTTTIRLLKTDKPLTKNKFNAFRIEQRHMADDNPNNNNNNNINSYSTPKITNKLASHPYLCRLRASNVENMERQHPKYLVKNDPISNTTAVINNNNNNNTMNKFKPPPPPPSPPTNNTKLGLVSKQIVQFINDSQKIPDIERV